MMYEMIRKRVSDTVPFASHIGVELTKVDDGTAEATVSLKPELLNHIKTAHAGVMFTLAETASGGAMGGAMAPYMMEARPIVSNSSIEYVKTGKTDLTAFAEVDGDPAAHRDTLKNEGKVVFDVNVSIKDQELEEVARVKITWHITIKK